GDPDMLAVMTVRTKLSVRVALALLRLGSADLCIRVLARTDLDFPGDDLMVLAEQWGEDARVRGSLLKRRDLPGLARLYLVERVRAALSSIRIVTGAVHPRRLERLMRDACDAAAATIGEREAGKGHKQFAAAMAEADQIN